MSAPQRIENIILSNLLQQNSVRAVLWLDTQGRVKDRRGVAFCLRDDSDETEVFRRPGSLKTKPTGEAVYVRSFAGGDFLVVIFDEGADFDVLKQRIDTIADGKI